jgi:hypothetical protein
MAAVTLASSTLPFGVEVVLHLGPALDALLAAVPPG